MTALTMATWTRLAAHLWPGNRLEQTWPLSGGLSAQMQAMTAAGPNGQHYQAVVRWYEGASRSDGAALGRQFRLLQALHAAGLAVPPPLHFDDSRQILPFPYLAMAFMPGAICFKPANLAGHMQQLATQLVRIHRLDTAPLQFVPRADSCGELSRPLPPATPPFDAASLKQQLQAVSPNPALNRPVLQHGDFWPGNSLWVDGRLSAIVDWEDAHLGEPLQDLAQSRAEISWIFGPAALLEFTRTYQAQQPLDYRALPYWDLCAALRMLRLAAGDLAGLAAFFHAYDRPDITANSIRHDLLAFITNAQTALGSGANQAG